MKLPSFAPRLWIAVASAVTLTSCGSSRSLQAVSVSPVAASSSAQFTATGTYNQSPMSADVTSTLTWCVGTPDGVCAGNIAIGASVNAGLAQCLPGFTGSQTILAGKAQPAMMPDTGMQLKPFGSAQLNCP